MIFFKKSKEKNFKKFILNKIKNSREAEDFITVTKYVFTTVVLHDVINSNLDTLSKLKFVKSVDFDLNYIFGGSTPLNLLASMYYLKESYYSFIKKYFDVLYEIYKNSDLSVYSRLIDKTKELIYSDNEIYDLIMEDLKRGAFKDFIMDLFYKFAIVYSILVLIVIMFMLLLFVK